MSGNPFPCTSFGGYANAATVDLSSMTRSYAATAFYAPIAQRTNLFVLTGVQAYRTDFAEGNGDTVANAVRFHYEGGSYVVKVGKEVVLAAGTFQSPKLLELSGIGNPDILTPLDIPVVIDSRNVGENLQDHLMTGISFEVNDGVMTGDSLMRQEPEAIKAATNMYQNHKAGPMTVGGIASHAFMSMAETHPSSGLGTSGFSTSETYTLELEALLHQHPADAENKLRYDCVLDIFRARDDGTGALFMFLAQTNLHNNEVAKDYLQNLQPGNFLSLGACQTHVFSRGSSHIVSQNISDAPRIDPRYFSHPLDLELFARHVQFLKSLARSSPLSDYIEPNGKRNHPTAYVENLADAKDYARTTAISCYHPADTRAMLPRHERGVVSIQMIVYGTTNLRVVDASVMPVISRSNLQSTVYAVAERAADLIKVTG